MDKNTRHRGGSTIWVNKSIASEIINKNFFGGNVFWINVLGVWKKCITWINVLGVWKNSNPKIKKDGIWY